MAKKLFETAIERQLTYHRVHCEPGSRIKNEYHPVYDKKGVWHLEKSGETSVYDLIQSFADSCDINVIISRYRNGEIDVLNKVQGTYGDFSNIPTNFADILNAKIKAEALFMSLSPDVREKYNNSVSQFMAEIGTKEGLEKLGYDFKSDNISSADVDPVVNSVQEVKGDVKE